MWYLGQPTTCGRPPRRTLGPPDQRRWPVYLQARASTVAVRRRAVAVLRPPPVPLQLSRGIPFMFLERPPNPGCGERFLRGRRYPVNWLMAIAVCIVVGLRSGDARGQGGSVTVYAVANLDCATWSASRNTNRSSSNPAVAWILGFVSGMNSSVDLGYDPLTNLSGPGAVRFIDDYCKTHPTATTPEAVDALFSERKARVGR